ncbi:putative ribonuclease H-like domain-containing protein [Tanacetum coccineum]
MKMSKAVYKQQFEAFSISSSEGLEKGYDRFQQLLSQLEAHGAEVSTEDANHKFLRSLPPAWSNLAMTMRTKPDVDILSIDDLYNNLRVFEPEIKSASKSSTSAQNVAFVSQSKGSANKVKSGHTSNYSTYTSISSNHISEREAPAGFADEVIYSLYAKQSEDLDLLHEDLEQIDDVDIEEIDINWQIAMIAIRMKKFYKNTGRRVRMDGKAPVGFDKKKIECYKCHNTGHFARECTSKGTNDGKKKKDTVYQDQEAGKQEKNQIGLLTMDDGVVNWGDHTAEEETNHALMAISSNSEVSLCSKTCIDSYNKLKALCDDQVNQLGEQESKILAYTLAVKKLESQVVTLQKQQLSLNEQLTFKANEIYKKDEKLKKYRRIGMKAVKEKDQLKKTIQSNNEVLSYEEEMNHSVFKCTKEDYVNKPLYSRFTKTNDFKGVPHPLSRDYTPKPQEEIDESLYIYGKKGPQEPESSVSADRSSECSTCQSNNSAGSIGISSEQSVDFDSEISRVPQEVHVSKPVTTNEKGVSAPKSKDVEPSCVSHIKTPRQQMTNEETPKVDRKNWNAMMEKELGEGYSFTKKKCFVFGSVSHLIKDCDFYEKKMAREADLKKQRVFNTGKRVEKPVWNKANKVNHANQFVPRPVQLNAVRPNVNTVRANVNSVRSNVNSVRPNINTGGAKVNSVRPKVNTGRTKQPVPASNSKGFNPLRPQVNKDHPLKNMDDRGIFDSGCSWHMTSNKDHLKDFEEFKGDLLPLEVAKEHGYRRGTIDKTLFIKKDKKDIMQVQVYVDDIIFGSTRKSWCDEFEALMKGIFQMSSMSELIFFLGLQVKQSQTSLFISQDKYVADMLKKFDLASVKTAITPMETKMALTKDEEGADVDVHLYRSMIGSLMYLTASRPDIMFAVCACSRFQVNPKASHLIAMKRLFKYLKGKPNLGLWYPRESPFNLEAFSDSDYAGANLDRKSTTGGCQFLGRRLISWQCKKQTIVATSTTEAEYVAAANCCGQILWIQNQLLDYGFNYMNTKIYIDNESTICIVKNPVFHSKTKHIEIRHHFIRDAYENKLIQVQKIHTDNNVADLLTKAFDGPRFNFLVVNIGMAKHGFKDGLKHGLTTVVREKVNIGIVFINSGSLLVNPGKLMEEPKKNSLKLYKMTVWSTEIEERKRVLSEISKIGGPRNTSGRRYGLFSFQFTPKTSHLNAVKRIFKYLKGKPNLGLWYPRESPFDLEAFSDSDYVATSTTEAEYVAAANCCGQVKVETVDFLRGSNLRYTLTSNPTIYDSLVKQFWQTATANTLADGTLELQATIDTIKVKKLEGILKRRNVVLSDSEEEEPEAQGRKSQDDPLVSLVQGLVTPSKTTVNASGEEQVEDISPTTLEAAKTLSRVASQKPKSIDKGRRYKRRKETKGKKVVTSLDFQEEVSTGYVEGVNTGSIKVSTVSGKVSTVSGQVSTDSIKKSIPSPDKGQREGKAPMIIEEAPKKTKEQIL